MIGAILGGLAGTALTGAFNRSNARRAAVDNREAMQNRHQWEMEDLAKAGLNPILSAKLGGTSGMPGVSAAMPDLGATVSAGINSAMNMQQTEANVDKITQEIANLKETEHLTRQQISKTAQEISVLMETW